MPASTATGVPPPRDVTDSATILQIKASFDIIGRELDRAIAATAKLAREHRETPMAGRSNLQQAVPMTFGFKMARLLATLLRHRERLGEIRPRIEVFEFGAAVGTLASLGDKGLDVQVALARELGLAQPIAWHTERDRIAEAGCFLGLLTGTLSKFATDLKLMMQTEVGEASEPCLANRGSSSTMPQKRNPISCCYIHACAASVRQGVAALLDATVEDHERATGRGRSSGSPCRTCSRWPAARCRMVLRAGRAGGPHRPDARQPRPHARAGYSGRGLPGADRHRSDG